MGPTGSYACYFPNQFGSLRWLLATILNFDFKLLVLPKILQLKDLDKTFWTISGELVEHDTF